MRSNILINLCKLILTSTSIIIYNVCIYSLEEYVYIYTYIQWLEIDLMIIFTNKRKRKKKRAIYKFLISI